mmetsp:Transcript_21721/g.51173  ORF Transcript_21721/g.51173 Transcript_21721/m.51173 type:complete len:107 (+) Transcript_21721:438-758(+)
MNVCGASRAEESVEGVLQRQAVVVAREEHTGARIASLREEAGCVQSVGANMARAAGHSLRMAENHDGLRFETLGDIIHEDSLSMSSRYCSRTTKSDYAEVLHGKYR